MKKVFAFFSAFALAGVGSAMALDIESGIGYHSMDESGAYDCDGIVKWEQLPNGGSGFSSQVDVCYPFSSSVADDFVGDGHVTHGVGWWGVYWNGGVVVPDAFEIKIYADAGGMPAGNPDSGPFLFSESTTDYHETFSGATEADYCTNFADPAGFYKEPDVKYWLGIQAVFCFPPQWGWSTGSGNGVDVWFGFPLLGYPYWVPGVSVFGFTSDMAFLLLNDIDSPTEDTTWSTIKNLYR
jgi:hypothetical protein